MYKVVLISADFLSMLSPCALIPLGLYHLASSLEKKEGVSVLDIVDLKIVRFNLIRKELERIAALNPDLIGISGTSFQNSFVHFISKFLKGRLPETIMVVGGPIATISPEKIMSSSFFDYAIMGEGELIFSQFIDCLQTGKDFRHLPGLVYRENGEIRLNPHQVLSVPLDDLPMIQWERVDFDRYSKFISMTFHRWRCAPILTSRGCPYHCIFCHKILGDKFRTRSVENVLKELHLLYHQYGVKNYEIVDDIFNFDYARATKILSRIRDELPEATVSFGNGLRLDHLDEPFIKLLKEVNCKFLGVPIETGCPRIQKISKKNLNLDKVKEIVSLLKKYRIYTWGFFMIGFPGETKEEMMQTLEFANDVETNFVEVQSLAPYEKTEVRDTFDKNLLPKYDMGSFFDTYGLDVIKEINTKKLKIMRARFLSKENWYFLINLILWKIYWLHFSDFFRHVKVFIMDFFKRNKTYTVGYVENSKKNLLEQIRKSLE